MADENDSRDAKRDQTENMPLLPILLGAGAIVAGAVLFAIVLGSGSSKNVRPIVPTKPAPTAVMNDSLNPWIHVDGAPGKIVGISDGDALASIRGFRSARQVVAPAVAFDIHQHEVTWGEIDPWLEKNPAKAFPRPTTNSTSADARKMFPAVGVPWNTALEYCRSIGATLPMEEQWELAARGPSMKKFPWGDTPPDWSRVHAFKGEKTGPVKVMSSELDRTEGPPEKAIYDLAGNAQEWTFSVWRGDASGLDDSWVQAEGITVQAIRGFPLNRNAPGRIDELSIAYRDWVCASGDCSPLSNGASPNERARKPRIELWPAADSTGPGALEWRRVIENADVMAGITRCFDAPMTTTLTIKASQESFCNRPELVPLGATCDGKPPVLGALARASGALPEATLKCVNYALHAASVANLSSPLPDMMLPALKLPDTQFSYTLYVTTDPREPIENVGFRCVRDVAK